MGVAGAAPRATSRPGARVSEARSVPFEAMRFAASAVLLVLGAGTSRAFAQPQIPATFFGSASVQGQTPPPESEVRAFIGTTDCTQLAAGQRTFGIEAGVGVYVVTVVHESQKAGCGKEGKQVTFKINGMDANQAAAWKAGPQQLDLNVGSGAPQQLPTPTPGPALTPPGAPTAGPAGSVTASTAPAGTRPQGTPPIDPVTLTPDAAPGTRPVPATTPPQTPPDSGSGGVATNPVLWVVLGVLVVLGGAGGLLASRKWPPRSGEEGPGA
jgi:hypothetical protein